MGRYDRTCDLMAISDTTVIILGAILHCDEVRSVSYQRVLVISSIVILAQSVSLIVLKTTVFGTSSYIICLI